MASQYTAPETPETSRLTGPTEDQTLLTGPTADQHLLIGPTVGKGAATPDKQADDPRPDKDGDKNGRGRIARLLLILAAVFGVLLLIAVLPRLARTSHINKDAKSEKKASRDPAVSTVAAQAPPAFDELALPGNLQAVQQTAIVARASGYLKRFYVDIGDTVRAGQLLATVETPDLDQQVAQARAQLVGAQAAYSQAQSNVTGLQANVAQAEANLSRADATLQQARTDLSRSRAALAQAEEASAQQRAQLAQALANLNLARVTAQRYQNLLAEGAIDQQTTDQAVASYQTNTANVQALRAALRASQANVQAFGAAVLSSQANVRAYAEGVNASRAAVGAAQANVRSGQDNARASLANIGSYRANVARFAALQGFQNVTAPFSGVITARNIDTGALISTSGGAAGGGGDTTGTGSGEAGTSSLGNAAGGSTSGGGSSPGGSGGGGQSPSLFSLAQIDRLRLYLSVPQTYISTLRPGQEAQITVREVPGRVFTGRINRTAGALDAASRTLVAEVELPNPQGVLRPGMFAEVNLRVPHPAGAVLIPDSALVTNAGGTQVVLVGKDNTVHFQPISVGRDFGQTIAVTSGLQAGQKIVANPTDSLREGEKVRPTDAPPAAPQGSQPGGQAGGQQGGAQQSGQSAH